MGEPATRHEVPDSGGPEPGAAVAALYGLTKLLREACPWDREQTAATIVPHTLEESYEVADVVRAAGEPPTAADLAAIADELGDLLFQVTFLTMWCEEHDPAITLDAVARGIHAKLVRRHPHVFGDDVSASTADEVRGAWEQVKRDAEQRGLFDGIPGSMPALGQARKVQSRAGGVGFDFGSAHEAMHKVREEMGELAVELDRARDQGTLPSGESQPPDPGVERELGDALFAIANVSRLARVDPELALRDATGRFRARVEGAIALARAAGEDFMRLDLDAQEAWYQRSKEQAPGV